ncbi:MAG: hypothetical protein R6X19_00090 [Kiritimatiellia bacterium]
MPRKFEQIVIALNRLGPEPSLHQATCPLVPEVIANRVGRLELMPKHRQIRLLSPHQQMHMIRHEAEQTQPHAIFLNRLPKTLQKARAFIVAIGRLAPIHYPKRYVVYGAFKLNPQFIATPRIRPKFSANGKLNINCQRLTIIPRACKKVYVPRRKWSIVSARKEWLWETQRSCAVDWICTATMCLAVESTDNWYWLVDGLRKLKYHVRPANTAKMQENMGLKAANDKTDARFIARQLVNGILPEGCIYPEQTRGVRDLMRRRMRLAHTRTGEWSSLESLATRHTGRARRRATATASAEMNTWAGHSWKRPI